MWLEKQEEATTSLAAARKVTPQWTHTVTSAHTRSHTSVRAHTHDHGKGEARASEAKASGRGEKDSGHMTPAHTHMQSHIFTCTEAQSRQRRRPDGRADRKESKRQDRPWRKQLRLSHRLSPAASRPGTCPGRCRGNRECYTCSCCCLEMRFWEGDAAQAVRAETSNVFQPKRRRGSCSFYKSSSLLSLFRALECKSTPARQLKRGTYW